MRHEWYSCNNGIIATHTGLAHRIRAGLSGEHMAIEFYLHAGPPPREVIEKTRECMERWFPLVALGLGADALLCGIMVLKLRGRPGQETILECGLLAMGLLALVLIWQLAKIISGLMKLNEAHPSTAHAYLECASRETVRSYSRAVIRQGRNMTMAEAGMLLKHCTTPEEIARLDAYYDRHAPIPEYWQS